MSHLNGASERPRAIPTTVLTVAILVAVGAVSALLYVLFQQTEGPGPVLREFAQQVRDEDCPGSYGLLDPSVTAELPEEAWCAMLDAVEQRLDAGFRVEQMVLRGRIAELTVRSRLATASEVWRLRKTEDRWRVLGPRDGFIPPL